MNNLRPKTLEEIKESFRQQHGISSSDWNHFWKIIHSRMNKPSEQLIFSLWAIPLLVFFVATIIVMCVSIADHELWTPFVADGTFLMFKKIVNIFAIVVEISFPFSGFILLLSKMSKIYRWELEL